MAKGKFRITDLQMGVSERGELYVFWTCLECQQEVNAYIPIEDLIAGIPAHLGHENDLTTEDKKFLHDFHITADG